MRLLETEEMTSGKVDITSIKIRTKSRDDIPQLLLGIQYMYKQKEIREQLFALLESLLPAKVSRHNGRPGMALWRVFVLGILRLNLNLDYDRLESYANEHRTIRLMLGHLPEDNYEYHPQTLKDNLDLFTPKILVSLNTLIVKSGYEVLKKSAGSGS